MHINLSSFTQKNIVQRKTWIYLKPKKSFDSYIQKVKQEQIKLDVWNKYHNPKNIHN